MKNNKENVNSNNSNLSLGFDLMFDDLYSVDGIKKIDAVFNDFAKDAGVDICDDGDIVALSMVVEQFLIKLFGFDRDNCYKSLFDEHNKISSIYAKKRKQEILKEIKESAESAKKALRYAGDERKLFDLTDPGVALQDALASANYCIVCHPRGKDSCSAKSAGGCPLGMKISQMIEAKRGGNYIAALVLATIDNPLLALTGHRICNDCRLGCIYKKDKVDVPSIETNILESVLSLPYGFEVYSLLTKWNPLRKEYKLLRGVGSENDEVNSERSSKNILVVGAGPSGIAASYYMLMEGRFVTNIDALKIEPFEFPFKPVKDCEKELFEQLSDRVVSGFGGVAEYGITVRWNKNYLKVIRLILERFAGYSLIDGVFFDGELKRTLINSGYFDAVISCVGAGKPRVLESVENNLTLGVRQASDFLMNLQLSGAFKDDSVANLQIRRPIVVIGGGLTAVDAATEAKAYYIAQVKKFKKRYDELLKVKSKEEIEKGWSDLDREVAAEFLRDGAMPTKDLANLVDSTIVYRGSLEDSPAYKLNREELLKAKEEGVAFVENLSPLRFIEDDRGYLSAIEFIDKISGEQRIISARTALVAIGTKEHASICSADTGVDDGADNNIIIDFPELGNVVKSIANVKDNIKDRISKVISDDRSRYVSNAKSTSFVKFDLCSTIHQVNALSSNTIELVIHSPILAKCFRPGQFFKLQNYHNNHNNNQSQGNKGNSLLMEPVALTGFWVDKDKGLISLIVLECGKSTRLCEAFQVGDKVYLMGPTGAPTYIPGIGLEKAEKVLLIGGGLGNAVLPSVGREIMKVNPDNEVHYIAGYRKDKDIFYKDYIRSSSHKTTMVVGDKTVIDALFDDYDVRELKSFDRIIMVGSVAMMTAVSDAIKDKSHLFKDGLKVISSVNAPMQCMMKGVCGQCIQRHSDGSYVFSCENQDQDAMSVDFKFLQKRLLSNSLLEKLTNSL